MRILSVESAGTGCSVALSSGTETRTLLHPGRLQSGEVVLPMVERLLAEAGLRMPSIDGVAFGAGPGSFTGLRIACSVAQGLAESVGVGVIGISTLEAIAEAAGEPRAVVCIDARMGEIFVAAYRRSGDKWNICVGPVCGRPVVLPPLEGSGWVGVGNGFSVHRAALERAFSGQIAHIRPAILPHAGVVARLAIPRLEAGEGVDASLAAPTYLRDKVAMTSAERARRAG